uniref:RRM domain-containing protein n=1 Tax=Rhizophagus irregularis (strain DAOM 181602 / DAOM 197198 / MUCL 43194) TaxID=747089 RepID=U9SM86_RHIID
MKHKLDRPFPDTANSVTQFKDIWAIICLGNSLRVCPAFYSKVQRDIHREHVAILAGIPKNIKEADLSEIALQVNAKAVNIPLSYNSYKPKSYAYLNFSSFESLEAAKELTIAFQNKGLTWHSPDEAKNLCHVCGRHGCSSSKCSPQPAHKTNDHLDKLYTRSNSRSRNRTFTERSNNPNRPNSSLSRVQLTARSSRNEDTTSQRNPHANAQSGSNAGPSFTPSSQPKSFLPPDVIEDIKNQLKDIAKQLHDLDEKVNWMECSITDHDYRIKELESTMNYDGSQDNSPSYTPNSYFNDAGWDYHQDIDDNNNNNNNNSSFSPIPANPNFSIMDTSPDAFFSTLNPNSILSSRHALLPNRVNLSGSPNDSTRLR